MDGSSKDRSNEVQPIEDLANDRLEWRKKIHVANPNIKALMMMISNDMIYSMLLGWWWILLVVSVHFMQVLDYQFREGTSNFNNDDNSNVLLHVKALV